MFIYLLEEFVRDIFSFLNLHESNGEAVCLPTACSRLFFFCNLVLVRMLILMGFILVWVLTPFTLMFF